MWIVYLSGEPDLARFMQVLKPMSFLHDLMPCTVHSLFALSIPAPKKYALFFCMAWVSDDASCHGNRLVSFYLVDDFFYGSKFCLIPAGLSNLKTINIMYKQ